MKRGKLEPTKGCEKWKSLPGRSLRLNQFELPPFIHPYENTSTTFVLLFLCQPKHCHGCSCARPTIRAYKGTPNILARSFFDERTIRGCCLRLRRIHALMANHDRSHSSNAPYSPQLSTQISSGWVTRSCDRDYEVPPSPHIIPEDLPPSRTC